MAILTLAYFGKCSRYTAESANMFQIYDTIYRIYFFGYQTTTIDRRSSEYRSEEVSPESLTAQPDVLITID